MKRLILVNFVVSLFFFFANPLLANDVLVTQIFYSGLGDGNVNTGSTTWSGTRNATTGGANYSQSQTNMVETSLRTNDYYWIHRAFFPIDTSEIPDDANILSANFFFFPISVDNYYLLSSHIIQTFQYSTSTLSADDFDNVGFISGGSLSWNKIQAGNYAEFSLNSTGIGWISKSGWTKIGMISDYDLGDSAPISQHNYGLIIGCFSDESGSAKDPYIKIKYVCDENNIPQSSSVISVHPYFPADYNNDGNVDPADISDLMEDIKLWINDVWKDQASF